MLFCTSTWLLICTCISCSWRPQIPSLIFKPTLSKFIPFEGADRRYTNSEDEHRHSRLLLFSRISTSPLNEIICPQNWQNLNFALLVLTTSFRCRGQQTRLSSRCFKRAGNNSNERKFTEAREPHAHPCNLIACSIYRNNCFFQVNERTLLNILANLLCVLKILKH
jgi:hypothetical protein